jgi:hypothetical protein
MRSLRKFWALPRREKAIFFEAGALLLLSSLSVRTLPFRHVDYLLRSRWGGNSSASHPDRSRGDIVRLINLSISRALKALPLKPLCLSQAIAAFVMLRRRQIPAIIYLGAKVEDASLLAHAWVNAGDDAHTGGPDNAAYAPLTKIS